MSNSCLAEEALAEIALEAAAMGGHTSVLQWILGELDPCHEAQWCQDQVADVLMTCACQGH
jgi:hypothetical protein